MDGQKIALARMAVEHALRLLKPTDRFSLVVFDDVVDVVVGSTLGSAEAKRHALRELSNIDARGSTNLAEVGANGDFWIVPSSGGTPRQLTGDLTDADGPTWTADGHFIIFSSMRGGSRTLWRVEASGGTPQPVTAGAGEDLKAAVSRDGRTLVYTNVRNQYLNRVLDPRRDELGDDAAMSRDGDTFAGFNPPDVAAQVVLELSDPRR